MPMFICCCIGCTSHSELQLDWLNHLVNATSRAWSVMQDMKGEPAEQRSGVGGGEAAKPGSTAETPNV